MVNTAGKTGTSSANKDKLFVGYTPYYTAGIWCGYRNNERSVTGTPHLELWDSVMKEIHELKLHNIDSPRGFSHNRVSRVAYCKYSGLRFSPDCAAEGECTLEYGLFIKGTEPRDICRHSDCLPVYESHNFVRCTFTFCDTYDKIKKGRRGVS